MLLGVLLAAAASARGVIMPPEQFLAAAFDGNVPPVSKLWITKPLAEEIRAILGRDLGVLRLPYRGRGHRTAWILEEIGKEKPITVGIAVERGRIASVQVLVYRESRGGEVQYPWFTRQFDGATLTPEHRLDRHIDGITGATLSVRALDRLARLALLLHAHSDFAEHG